MAINLRDYQSEVVKPALEGKNIIIWLPTGGGKTRAAVFVTKHHLDSRRGKGKGKAAVLVNKVSLVNQHYESEFKPLLNGEYGLVSISGVSDLKNYFGDEIRRHDVVICTAQILYNALLHTDEEKHVDLTEFSLLIIDECHHTQKDGVYNQIMAKYIEMKQAGERGLPQILGLTASPGTDGANTLEKAQEHILKICANMDASMIMSASVHLEQLRQTVPLPVKRYDIAAERKQDPFGDQIKRMMRMIHSHLGEDSIKGNLGSQIYEQAVVELEKEGAIESNRRKQVSAHHLRKYNDSLLVNDAVRMIDAFRYLQDFYTNEEATKTLLDDTDRFLLRLFKDQCQELHHLATDVRFENPKLEKLEQTLLERFAAGHSQGIIFTKTRQSTHALVDWIRACPQLMGARIKAEVLTGAGISSQTKHMTQQQQQDIIKKFRDGVLNLLVATSVAEEGLDIKECNVVIRYGLITNEIAMVQARGRARAEGSIYSVVADPGSREIQREFTNEHREQLMKRAIEAVQSMEQRDYLLKIRELQMEETISRKLKQSMSHTKKKENCPDAVRFFCSNCNEAVCHGCDLRLIEGMHHVNINPNFSIYYKVSGIIPINRKFEDWKPGGKVSCRKCGQAWGMEMIYRALSIPSLNIKNFIVETPRERRTYKQWKSVPCQIQEFNYVAAYESMHSSS